ncbi:MAG TPA: amino acid adenylation domain-containing protein, partial [Roseiflexaceae bacterium]|nr:amino acid adenylation domain-containing protein [Roseiflexaceae bacterium]
MQDDQTRSETDLLAEELELFRYLLEEEGVVVASQGQIPRRTPSAVVPLSLAQERMWFLDQMQPGNPAANISFVVRLSGRLHVEAFQRSLNAVVQRHEGLRTTFATVGGQPQQQIAPELTLPLELVDLRGLPATDQEPAVQRLVREHARHRFDLQRGPLLYTRLLQRADDEFLLLVTTHHIVSDAWSVGVLLRECAACYAAFVAGQPQPLPALPVQYPDFAVWQRDWLHRPDENGESPLQRQLAYWKRQLAGAPAAIELPTDRPRPPAQTFVGAKHRFTAPPALTASLHELSQREGASLFMTLLAAFQVLLARWSGQDDIAVGSPIANRTRPEIEGLIGFFVNTLVLRGDVSGNPTFRELLGRVRETTLGAYDHQDLPFERLVEELRPPRDLSRTPLFQVLFTLQNAPLPTIELGELSLRNQPFETATVQFDLEFSLVEINGGLNVQIDYNVDLFDAATIVRMAGHFQTLLAGIVADPDRPVRLLPLLTEAEGRRFATWNRAPWPLPQAQCLHELVARQAEHTPDATALVVDSERLSYHELDTRANRLANLLQTHGVGPERCVGICMTRTAELVVGLLAVLKAGGAYVPLDPAYPPDRIAFMLADSGATVLLTTSATDVELPFEGTVIDLSADADAIAAQPSSAPITAVTPDNLAYLIYTSGSTGRPKGVAIAHRTAAARIAWAHATYSQQQLAGVLASTSVCFDLSIFELFAPLSSGGTVILAANALTLPTLPAADEVTLVNTVPSAMAALLSSGGLPASVTTVNLAGEPLPLPLVQQIYAQTAATAVYNLYGPSEDTTYSTGALIPPDATSVTIGRPLPHTEAYLLDRLGEPVPVGVIGEIYLGGAGITRGYYARPELTAERFVPNPFGVGEAEGWGLRAGEEHQEPRTVNQEPGSGNSKLNTQNSKLYKTGDLARFRPDGTLDYLGRIDHQVKLRGFRIELGEIESALRRHPDVRDAVVTAREDGGDKRIVAYVVLTQKPEAESTKDTKDTNGSGQEKPGAQNQGLGFEDAELKTQNSKLKTHLRGSLPDYMVPSAFVVLDALPLTPNGKVDRKA